MDPPDLLPSSSHNSPSSTPTSSSSSSFSDSESDSTLDYSKLTVPELLEMARVFSKTRQDVRAMFVS
jgi:hypothetical protein